MPKHTVQSAGFFNSGSGRNDDSVLSAGDSLVEHYVREDEAFIRRLQCIYFGRSPARGGPTPSPAGATGGIGTGLGPPRAG